MITIYTDGSVNVPERRIGFGWVLVKDGREYINSSEVGFDHTIPGTDNNLSELYAAIYGIRFSLVITDKGWTPTTTIATDSMTVIDAMNGIKTCKGFTDVVDELRRLTDEYNIIPLKVPAHNGKFNMQADNLARKAAGLASRQALIVAKRLRQQWRKASWR